MTPERLLDAYARLRATEPDTGALSLLQLGTRESHLLNGPAGEAPQSFVLRAGTEAIGTIRFAQLPPNALQLENAIAVVEDQIAMLARALLPTPTLHLHLAANASLSALFDDSERLRRDRLEQHFNRLAEVAEGLPLALSGLPDDAEFAPGLLILRELMHHLNFSELVRIR